MNNRKNMPWLYVAVICGITAGLSGCQGVNGALTSMNNGLTKMNADLAASSQSSILDAGAPVSSVMTQAASNTLMQSAQEEGNSTLLNAVQQAKPAMDAILKSWMSGVDCRGVEMYMVPGSGDYACIANAWPYNAPRNVGLILQSVGDWRVITANSFSFSAHFCSSVSQTCMSVRPTLINMGEGWQIKFIG